MRRYMTWEEYFLQFYVLIQNVVSCKLGAHHVGHEMEVQDLEDIGST